jgi:hypothetical protein
MLGSQRRHASSSAAVGAHGAVAAATSGVALGSSVRCSSALDWASSSKVAERLMQQGAEPGASSNSSSSGGIAARQELLRVMRQAQDAMAASAHLRTRQNTHLPAASSSLASRGSTAAAAAAAVAADVLASRGTAVAGSRKGAAAAGCDFRGSPVMHSRMDDIGQLTSSGNGAAGNKDE